MRTLVLSDLRLELGGDPSAINSVRALVEALMRSAAGPLRVVLNGDTFDFPSQRSSSLVAPVAVAHAILDEAASVALITAFRGILAAGGELLFRPAEHDGELIDPRVEARFRRALDGAASDDRQLQFVAASAPITFDTGGARIVIVRPPSKHDAAAIRWIASKLLNPLRTHYGLGLAEFLRPDYTAATLAALAVNPTSVKLVLRDPVAAGVWRDLTTSGGPSPIDLPREMAIAGLSEREREVLLRMLDPAVEMGDLLDVDSLDRARLKLFRHSLIRRPPLVVLPREIVGEEWRELRALGRRLDAAAIVSAASDRCGWRSEATLTAVATGSWTWRVARPTALDPAAWRRVLDTWQRVATSQVSFGSATSVDRRFTAALVEPLTPDVGARVSLIEWRAGVGVVLLRERAVIDRPR